MKKLATLLLILLLGQLAGCGFHLRGSITLPDELKKLYLFGASQALKLELEGILHSSNGKIMSSPNESDTVIKVFKEDLRRRVLSIGATGKANEFELNYYLRFQIYDRHEKPLLDEQTIEVSREYFNDQTAILAKEAEEQTIRKEIYQQVARMLLARSQLAIETGKK